MPGHAACEPTGSSGGATSTVFPEHVDVGLVSVPGASTLIRGQWRSGLPDLRMQEFTQGGVWEYGRRGAVTITTGGREVPVELGVVLNYTCQDFPLRNIVILDYIHYLYSIGCTDTQFIKSGDILTVVHSSPRLYFYHPYEFLQQHITMPIRRCFYMNINEPHKMHCVIDHWRDPSLPMVNFNWIGITQLVITPLENRW